MKHHPYTQIWPLMNLDDLEKFQADIAANGQRLPILTYNDMVIDGRNREVICNRLGIKPRYEDSGATSDSEALALVISLNEHRRHLSVDQRAIAAEKLANIIHGSNRHVEKIVEISKDISITSKDIDTHSRAISLVTSARAMDVPPIRVARMRGIKKYGGQTAVDEVLNGKISLGAQYEKVVLFRNKKEPSQRSKSKRQSGLSGPYTPLTREQVDPEFKGTPTEFLDKYGHIQVMTAEGYAKERFTAWALNLRAVAKAAKQLPDWPQVDHNWLRSPRPSDIAKLTEALEYLRPKIAEAEALFARVQSLRQPSGELLPTD